MTGLGLTLVIWASAGIVLAAIAGLALRSVTQLVTRGARRGRARVTTAATLFPFYCIAWAAFMFMFQAFISENMLHRDAGVGETWHCYLPNGYALLMIDNTSHGWVYDPKIQPGDTDGKRGDAVANVRTVQVAGRYILGAAESKVSPTADDSSTQVDSFFLLDTQAGKHMAFNHYPALAFQAKQLGVEPNLEPINSAYARYRASWFDLMAALMAIIPPLAGTYFLGKSIAKVRRTRPAVPQRESGLAVLKQAFGKRRSVS
ncbi:MAG TPA: hypothetical protein VKW06_05125 [Candidatus Angelobacter sp.]|nr:hypothetical protein [Candidatus Angelobacter sp.]